MCDTVNRVKLLAAILVIQIKLSLSFIWTFTYCFNVLLELETIDPMATVPATRAHQLTWQSKSKVNRGNSNTNFNLLGLLPPINGQHPQCLCCRIQQPLPIHHGPVIVAKCVAPHSRRWKWSPYQKSADGEILTWHATTCVCTSLPPQHTI